ncbi:peptide ABC transporter permease [Paraoerskovia sediminicola]|uniref:Peptide ABC transporter permease n=1 Tax=Paraoerskovia sediminicola TaxID=1138587 RepID=A0ABM8G4R6_9CELL|nr:peptide MFS transporter [Paraoerskovia sediminicola]BDZ43032.1 peptide ABC transporter permease [Paraoerskovia sediminicola]
MSSDDGVDRTAGPSPVAEPEGAPAGDHLPGERAFFGHPRGLMTLFTTEMWERFSYYGMRAILLYYLTDTVLNGGLGFDEVTGEAFVAIYGTSVYLLSVVGGWMADRVIGARRSVLYGGVIITAGHVALSVPGIGFSMTGIALVALGTGLLKPNVSSMVGELYARDDDRRDSAFSIFYMGINIGSLAAPFLVGAAEEWGGYHAGFSVAAFGMAFALVFFVVGRKYLGAAGAAVPNPIRPEEKPALVRLGLLVLGGIAVTMLIAVWIEGGWDIDAFIDGTSYLALAVPIVMFVVMFRSDRVDAVERARLRAYIPLFVAAMFFWMIFEQAATTLATFAKDRTDLDVLGFQISPAFFQSANPLFIVALAPVFAWIWQRTHDRPPTAYKFVLGLAIAASSFLFLSAASAVVGDDKAPAWVLITVYLIQTIGELCLSPVGLAATTLLAPKAFRAQAMAIWFLASAAGQAITAQTIKATEGVSDTAYFGGIGAVAMLVALGLLALAPWVTRTIAHANEMAGRSGD